MEIQIAIHKPDVLNSPKENINDLIRRVKNTVGVTKFLEIAETVFKAWGYESGYHCIKSDDTYHFVHVSLDPKDFVK